MPFKFQWLCELLEELHNNRHERAATIARSQSPDHRTVLSWFNKYDHKIERTGRSAIAFLSSIFPERRVDRVYNLQEKRLSSLFGRALGLGFSRAAELNQWRERDGDDFPRCVERVMRECEFDPPAAGREVTLEEIDTALHRIAANSPFSSPSVKASANISSAEDLLRPILLRLKSSEAKWLIRLMFKSFGPVQIPERTVLKQFHFLLPDLLIIQNSFDAAVKVLEKATVRVLPPRPEKHFEMALRPLMARELTPELGIMVRRQPYHKARSIKHCCNIVNKRQMSVERKYDGEYCQIHIDLSKGHNCLQIFSKSGKDSTNDRFRLHGVINDSLRLDLDGCKIRNRCIIEGELLVWSSSKKQILPFHKIRKHVKHGGRFLGTVQDSPVKPDEELMIVFYDLLMLDDKMLLNESHTTRRRHLKGLVRNIEGRSIIGERSIIDFNSSRASSKLREAFAHSITQNWEGLVLKACDEPFFSFKSNNHGIKMKKDYITGLGDSADLCLVGGRRDARIEHEIGLGSLRWTSFHVGCLTNKEDVARYHAKPCIKIIDELTSHNMPAGEFLDLNKLGRLVEVPFRASIEEYNVEVGHEHQKEPTELFKRPFIIEIMGAGFERLSNSSFYTLRFPRKIDRQVKIHTDRTVLDTVSFAELQKMAKQSFEEPQSLDSQEDAIWIQKLIEADGKTRNTQDTSQSSTRTPRSATTMSLSPVQRRKTNEPPIYVRADTEDRNTPERQSLPSPASTSYTRSPGLMPVACSERQNNTHVLSDVATVLSAIKSPVPKISALHISQRHNSNISGRSSSFKRSRELAVDDWPGRTNNKRCRLSSSHSSKQTGDRSPVRELVVIDLTTSPACPNPRRNPLSTINLSPNTVVVNHCAGVLPSSASSLLTAATSTLLSTKRPVTESQHHTNMEVSTEEVGRDHGQGNKFRSNHAANISRRRATDQTVSMAPAANHRSIIVSETRVSGMLPKSLMVNIPDAPTNSALPASHATTHTIVQGLPTPSSSAGILRDTTKLSDQGMVIPSFELVGPIFITDSLYNLKAKSQKGLNNMLQQLQTGVTFSIERFLDQIDDSITSAPPGKRPLHIMLVNFRDVEGAKKDVEEVFEHLIFRGGGTASTPGTTGSVLRAYSNMVLVFDYKVLTKCEGGELDIETLKALRGTIDGANMFGGIVKVDRKRLELGREPKCLLLTDWTWAE